MGPGIRSAGWGACPDEFCVLIFEVVEIERREEGWTEEDECEGLCARCPVMRPNRGETREGARAAAVRVVGSHAPKTPMRVRGHASVTIAMNE